MPSPTISEAFEALRVGRAYADLSPWRKVLVEGSEARGWLNDLLSADLSGLEDSGTRRSLLLSPTGRIRADVTVAATGHGLLLLQEPGQPAPIDRLLQPYVLSSDVALRDRSQVLAVLAFPGGAPPALDLGEVLRPSSLGPGADLLLPSGSRAEARAAVADLVEADPEAVEAWRIERGFARFGVDLGQDSLPHEAGLDHVIAYQKGCFLGQEAVARVRNLGHPPFVVLAVRGRGPVASGEPVVADDEEAGAVTSASDIGGGRTAAIVRVRWAARGSRLLAAGGTLLESLGPASGA
jgi:folate-binding protein YgfZ